MLLYILILLKHTWQFCDHCLYSQCLFRFNHMLILPSCISDLTSGTFSFLSFLNLIVVQVQLSPFYLHYSLPPQTSPLPTLDPTPFGFVQVFVVHVEPFSHSSTSFRIDCNEYHLYLQLCHVVHCFCSLDYIGIWLLTCFSVLYSFFCSIYHIH